jgi:hypothetical protein
MEGFRRADHEMILDCLNEDIVWIIPGMFRICGKEAFDREIENDQFIGKPIARTSEENNRCRCRGNGSHPAREWRVLRVSDLRRIRHERRKDQPVGELSHADQRLARDGRLTPRLSGNLWAAIAKSCISKPA